MLALRGDQLRDGFRVGKRHFSVKERALGKLPRSGGYRPGVEHRAQNALRYIQAAVARYLGRVFPRITARSAKNEANRLVHFLRVVLDGSVIGAVPFRCAEAMPSGGLKHRVRYGQCVRTGNAHNADSSGRRSGGNGRDGGCVGHCPHLRLI
ncbi:hypothetical protein SDC9_179756 [bioreactor metagenome]|uniref:Uncharacterized protein n=1 Tax=bioreactor metagenome TaxID=1076179 RepID=A0A645GZW4_9ZZZZ